MSDKKMDKCYKDMATQAALCLLMPNTKMIRVCMEGVSKDFVECHTGVLSGDQANSSNCGKSSGGWINSKYGPIQKIKNPEWYPEWYPGCQSKCSYYVPEYFYKDHNGNFVHSDGTQYDT
jgi:hypothetical protein